MYKEKNKTDLCMLLHRVYGFMRVSREIEVIEYDKLGYIHSFAVKLGCHYLCFSWFSDSTGYEVNKDLTFKKNESII